MLVILTSINEKKLTYLSKTFKSSTSLHQLSMMDIYFLELGKGCRDGWTRARSERGAEAERVYVRAPKKPLDKLARSLFKTYKHN